MLRARDATGADINYLITMFNMDLLHCAAAAGGHLQSARMNAI